MAAEEILKFMQNQNRPFSANDILQNVGKEHGKSAVQKALNQLVNKNKLFEKLYGKQTVYCVTQEDIDTTNIDEGLKSIDRKINEVSINLKTTEDEIQQKMGELTSLRKKMTLTETRNKVNDLKNEIEDLNDKLNEYADSATESISNEEKLKISQEYEMYVKEYRKRKRMCKEILDAILEGYPKSKKHLLEEIGIETDEDAGFTFVELTN